MRDFKTGALSRIVIAGLALTLGVLSVSAVTIELKDVASDRVERQRAAAVGSLPLPGTPDLANFEQRLATKGVKAGDAVFIRIFKAESELEIWMRSGTRFVLLDIYPICHWSGTIGPKTHEGDKQTPEGFYEVTRQQLHLIGRHPRSLNLGFPNSFDKSQQRTGSYILVHGGCSSVGCFAMTNTVIAEIYELTERALKGGQDRVHVHVFPFRMTDANMRAHASSEWLPFWTNLKEGYDAFEESKQPPQVGVCEKRYNIQSIGPEEVAATGPLAVCGETLAALADWDRLSKVAQLQVSRSLRPHSPQSLELQADRQFPQPRILQQAGSRLLPLRPSASMAERRAAAAQRWLQFQTQSQQPEPSGASPTVGSAQQKTALSQMPGRSSLGAAPPADVAPCDRSLASCRRWLELRRKAEAKAFAMRDGQPAPGVRRKTAARSR